METLNQTQKKYAEYKNLSLPEFDREILAFWERENVFLQSVDSRKDRPTFTFYEGPPSANGKPGIHHVMARTIKDLFCRYKTLQNFQVKRKGGWDTHGLPIELKVEEKLGITKDDIGKTISIEDYNARCRSDVLQFKGLWDDITVKMGYWVDLDDPYITFENDYIESVWNLLKRIYDKGLMYKGKSIQPYSPAAGTGLSSHELNQPGTYKEVKDTSAIAMFKIKEREDEYFIAWTTTPWTLPSNTALAVGGKIDYVKVETFNRYTGLPMKVILAERLVPKYFSEEEAELSFEEFEHGNKKIPWKIVEKMKGQALVGTEYEQLLPYVQPDKPAFRVVHGDFVKIEDGTGIVHIAPTFGADDFKVAAENGIPPLMIKDADGNLEPLVDKSGRFVAEMGEFAGRYVKNYTEDPNYVSLDVDIVIKLKKSNRCFKAEKYEHSYPHCWRTDKPILYYPLDSWFIRTTAVRDRLVELNKTIRWKPEATGQKRFGNWLENLIDWNLSRSRFWGTPLPIWATEDMKEQKCIGSVAELRTEVEKSIAAGHMEASFLDTWDDRFDLHRPWVDEIVLVADSGTPMKRQPDLIDVWFDSGAMPYAQWHSPFENQDIYKNAFPADFIAEGVDQTRGWFFTLHAIAVMLEDSVAYKSVIANGLVLDGKGEKMSKRKGNVVDPFVVIDKYGADATRWYMVGNAPPWDDLKFDFHYLDEQGKPIKPKKLEELTKAGTDLTTLDLVCPGIIEVQRRFFGTLYNTYNFFALYANIDGFTYSEDRIAAADRTELDRWIISLLNSLCKNVEASMEDLDATRAVRAIDNFVVNDLSNWYVRQARRRFWKGEMTSDKISAYQTLYECLVTVAKLMSPFAPFFSETLFRDLNAVTGQDTETSVHLTLFPEANEAEIDPALETRMAQAQSISSLVHSIRKKEKLRVRQPLARIMVPANTTEGQEQLRLVESLILQEVNVKALEFIDASSEFQIVKQAKPNFPALGPKYGRFMKEMKPLIMGMTGEQVASIEAGGTVLLDLSNGEKAEITIDLVEIVSSDIPGWAVATDGKSTVALDITLSDELVKEGLAREFINRIQSLRKNTGFEVTDRISVQVTSNETWDQAINQFLDYICSETLANKLTLVTTDLDEGLAIEINGSEGKILIQKDHVG